MKCFEFSIIFCIWHDFIFIYFSESHSNFKFIIKKIAIFMTTTRNVDDGFFFFIVQTSITSFSHNVKIFMLFCGKFEIIVVF